MLLKQLIIIIILVLPYFAIGQGTASIAGLVSSEDSGDPVPYATVALLKDGAVVEQIQTNRRGGYHFSEIQAGKYKLLVSQRGYTPIIIENIHILTYQHFDLNPSFEYGSYNSNDTLRVNYRDLITTEGEQFGVVNEKERGN
jgi:hypothetical protein